MTPPRHVVVVGAGLGGLRTVESLRREGFDGRITLVGEEEEPPYDRPPLSKEVLTGARTQETVYLRPPERLAALEAELILGQPAAALSLDERTIDLGASELEFEALVIATGASPRTLDELDGRGGVHTLRTLGDSIGLRAALLEARHVTVIGAGFIGSEVAASARTLGCDVTIVELEQTPLARALGPEMGALLMGLHREHGTELRLGVHVVEVEGDPVRRLRLSDGSALETDVVVVGIGVVPNIAWLDGSGLELANGVVCDASLRATDGVYAIGDVASWPNELFGRRMRVEHWTNTGDQARHAARNLLHGTEEPFVGSNYVWSDQYGYRIQFVGSTLGAVAEVVAGDPAAREFLAWYREDERLVGAIGIGLPKLLMKSRVLIEERRSWNDALAELEA
jgi:NADPH-dependent 2,4-dienoyl-CoA reductase/sulfur reductase-like enzyme